MNLLKKYREGLSERKRVGIRYAVNVVILLFTIWVTVSTVSYVFTWRQDQSALAQGGAVENAAASTGLSAGHFLVTDSFPGDGFLRPGGLLHRSLSGGLVHPSLLA